MTEDKNNPKGTFSRLMNAGAVPKKETEKPAVKPKEAVQKKVSNITNNITSKQVSNITSNITILQSITEDDIADLRDPAYMSQTFRLKESDIIWAKDTAYQLSKELGQHKKVSQTDIVRLSFKFFKILLASNKAELKDLLNKIKS